jgi:hypothetical protein
MYVYRHSPFYATVTFRQKSYFEQVKTGWVYIRSATQAYTRGSSWHPGSTTLDLISSSRTAPPPVLSPSSTVPPPSSDYAFIPARKNSTRVSKMLSRGVKRPGREVDHSPPSSDEVNKSVELYLYSPYTPSWCKQRKLHFFYLYLYRMAQKLLGNRCLTCCL